MRQRRGENPWLQAENQHSHLENNEEGDMKLPIPRCSAWLIAGALGWTLSACEIRSDAPLQDPETDAPSGEEDAASESGAAPIEGEEAAPAPASIIREEVREEAPPEVVAVDPLTVTIPFGDSGNDIDAAAETMLADVLQSPALAEGWPVTLRGHTDSSGNDRANVRASRARAEAVAAWLVEGGVDDARIAVIPFGEQNPIAPNALPNGEPDEQGRATNRRVEIEIAPSAEPEEITFGDEDA